MEPGEEFFRSQSEAMRGLAAVGHPKAEAMIADLDRTVAAHASVADQIRALDKLGYSRADIGRLLGKRYQHVRNVLEEDKRRSAGPVAAREAPSASAHSGAERPPIKGLEPEASVQGDTVRLRVRPDGSVLLLPEVLDALGARSGGMVIGEFKGDGELLLRGPQAALRHIRSFIEPWRPGEPLWSEELIKERREEDRRESEGG